LKDFIYITDKAYKKEDLLNMEFQILSALSFDITLPTPLRFLEQFIKSVSQDVALLHYSQFLIELALTDIRMIQYS
jgi:cyclin B